MAAVTSRDGELFIRKIRLQCGRGAMAAVTVVMLYCAQTCWMLQCGRGAMAAVTVIGNYLSAAAPPLQCGRGAMAAVTRAA